MKGFLVNLLMVFASIGFCCLLAEGAFRLYTPPPKQVWTDRPTFYYTPRGAENLQGNLHTKEKPPSTFRIAVVGDSFTFAPFMQYDDSFTARLERMLNMNHQATRVEVINYGVPGFSTNHEVPLVKRALDEQADLILLEITLNDPERKPYQPAGITIRQNDQGAIVVDSSDPGASWLARHSRLYRFLFKRVDIYKQGKSYEQYFRDLYRDQASISGFEKALQQMKQAATEKRIPLVAVVFPLFGTKLDESYPFHAIHEQIASILQKHGIPALDLETKFRGIPAERLQVMPGEDFHPNEIGHRIAAEKLMCWFISERFIPEDLVPRAIWKQRAQLQFPAQPEENATGSVLRAACS